MKLYCLIIGTIFLFGSVILLLYRLYFIRCAETVNGIVVDKIYRNRSTETRTSKTKVLKISYQNPTSGSAEYASDTSVITPFFKINDSLKLSVMGNKVLIKHWLYLILAPVALLIIGIACVYLSY